MQDEKAKESRKRKYQYDQRYLKKNVVTMGVTFNRQKPDDMVLLDWVRNRDETNVSYIKRLIRQDMERFE